MKKLKKFIHLLKEYNNDRKLCKGSPVKLFNFCNMKRPEEVWFYNFIHNEFSGKLTPKKEIAVFSVYGTRAKIKLNRSPVKIFFTSENIDNYYEYRDHCLNDVDLVLGFENLHNQNYLRFPLWILYFIPQSCNHGDIRKAVYNMSHFNYESTPFRKFCSMVSSHDGDGIRPAIYHSLSEIEKVDSGGAYLNNTSDLKELCNDDKRLFLTRYKFNICPENSDGDGYVTEKLFEAINSGCIPIYMGSNNNPEPAVINKDAVLFYSGPDSLEALKKQVAELHSNEKLYREFISQERFLPTATEYVLDTISELKKRIKELL
ncbi:glycosyltransferase family 10 domain-containing protein [Pararcticibacter amylolyticus]|uniref:Uncharacterized protein n=1 Tax=Pararcticibacter amylolyticus TaxID=2173175 RepID=A0A2U2PI41_9SPHI|nr:glycosyltransferase family 10 [Pararcticibacter amylolyticus]PWG81065.1 hypothetical protein DDR33_09065 [Pararcticibacter amylolyticus]